jgi:hypothetical protein
MSTRPRSQAGDPMTIGNIRANGVRSLDVSCWQCHHRAIMSADPWSDDVPVPTFGPRMVCTRCGIVGADARPNWQEKPPRETLTGVQWRRVSHHIPTTDSLAARRRNLPWPVVLLQQPVFNPA